VLFERIAFATSAILLSLSLPKLVFLPVMMGLVLEFVEGHLTPDTTGGKGGAK
jgi:hypothetical protein